MGQGNKLIVSATGFPGTNKTLRFIQDAFREPLGALAQLAGNKTIITGVVNTAGVISNGFISYNGEIIPFQGGNYAATVTIIEAFENVNYNTDANDDTVLDSLPAYRTIYAMCGTGGIDIFNFSELTPLKTIKELSQFGLPAGIVIDPNYVRTDVNFTIALLNKLDGIEAGAQKNVQPDLNQIDSTADDFVKNNQTIKFLRKGVFNVVNPTTDDVQTVSFATVNTNVYMVIGSMVSNSSNFDNDNDVIWMIREKTNTSFKIAMREVNGAVQNLTFEYILIPL